MPERGANGTMETVSHEVVRTSELVPGEFFMLHQGMTKYGVPALAAVLEGWDDLRLVPFEFPSDPGNAFSLINENAFGGTALKLPNARVEIDYRSASNSSGAFGSNAKDAIIITDGEAHIPLHNGITVFGYLDFSTGIVKQRGLGASWIAFDRWRVVDGSEQAVELFASAAWGSVEDER